jgi:geranylgeranyl diphosphate synthase type II
VTGPAAVDHVDAVLRADIQAELAVLVGQLQGDDSVTSAVRYAVASGGKRIRPVLCLAAMDAAGNAPGSRTAQVRAACALELMHTYSLVHDDLPCMDDDDLRRGQRTAHRVYGSSSAAAAGIALIPLACRTHGRPP